MSTEHVSAKDSNAVDKRSAARESGEEQGPGLNPAERLLPTHASILSLERSAGNQAVQRLLLSRQVAAPVVLGGKGAAGDEFIDRQIAFGGGGKGAISGTEWVHRQAVGAFQRQHSRDGIGAGQRQLLGLADAGPRDHSPTIRRKGKDAAAGGQAPNVTKKTVSGPTNQKYGGFKWVVQWELDQPSPTGGWIVQKVEVAHAITKTDGSKVGTGFDAWAPYWEAWQVKKGKKVTTYAAGGDVEDDTFSKSPSPADSQGTFEENGSAAFYEGLKLPSSFKANTKSPAGILPIVQADPGLTGGSTTLAHSLKAVWDGVGSDGTTTVTTV